GTPMVAGSYPMTVQLCDAAPLCSTQAVTFIVKGTLPVISAILATNVDSNTVTITWTTDLSASSQVCYAALAPGGTPPDTCTTEADLAGVTSHSVTLNNVYPNFTTQYYPVSRGINGGVPVNWLKATVSQCSGC